MHPKIMVLLHFSKIEGILQGKIEANYRRGFGANRLKNNKKLIQSFYSLILASVLYNSRFKNYPRSSNTFWILF